MASFAARDMTRCPMPLSPSRSAVAGALRVAVMFGRLLKPPALSRRTYCGRRKMPCPSAPVRSASLINSAQHAASGCGSPAAKSASAIRARVARTGMRATSVSCSMNSVPPLLHRHYCAAIGWRCFFKIAAA
jgi:hypothetical protein